MKLLTGIVIGVVLGYAWATIALTGQPNWTCNAEDEVLIINNTCQHIDEIQ